jgi:hypothetical protein
MRTECRENLYNVLEYDEIMRRLINVAAPLMGPTGYPVMIVFCADNECEPPKIEVRVIEYGKQGTNAHAVFEHVIDQNTTCEEFNMVIYGKGYCSMQSAVELCASASRNKTTYAEECQKRLDQEYSDMKEEDLPF